VSLMLESDTDALLVKDGERVLGVFHLGDAGAIL
jgi:hypothetical protein